MWDENEAKEYNELKVRNVRQMSLKESKVKETVKSGPFEELCAKKGLEREKWLWERKAEKEKKMKENDMKEIQNERKRSRRKKIELYRNCKNKLKTGKKHL